MRLDSDLTPIQVEQAAQYLMTLREISQPGGRLPETCRPVTLDSGWHVQRRVSELLAAKPGGRIAGWKCGLPDVGKRVLAPIYAESVSYSPPTESIAVRAAALRVELEFAFVLARDLPVRDAPYTPADVDVALEEVHLALELIGGRYARPNETAFPELLADGLFNDGLVLGPVVVNMPEVPRFTLGIHAETDDADPVQTNHVACHGDSNPRLALYWLAEHLRQQGLGLQAGQTVITGALAGVIELPAASRILLQLEQFGEWALTFHRSEPTVNH